MRPEISLLVELMARAIYGGGKPVNTFQGPFRPQGT